MRLLPRKLSYLAALSLIALLMLVPSAGAQEQNAWLVYIGDNFFEPADAAIEPGSTITWINNGNVPHTVTADNGLFDSGVLYPGDSYTVWFDGQGTVTYYCAIHPEMRGSVTVGGGEEPAAMPTEGGEEATDMSSGSY